MHVGEAGRSVLIAKQYGQRLREKSGNYSTQSLDYLISEYPSHGFIIDREEMEKLFKHVRKPTPLERSLVLKLGEKACTPQQSRDNMKPEFLSKELPENPALEAEQHGTQSNEAGSAGPAPEGAAPHVSNNGGQLSIGAPGRD